MPTRQYQQQRFNPLGAESDETMQVQVDSASYHEIKVYNGTRDALWLILGGLTNKMSMDQIGIIGNEIYITLLRADSIWRGIESGALAKAENMKVKRQTFTYKDEFLNLSSDAERYIDFIRNPGKFTNQYGDTESEYTEYRNLNLEGRVEFLKKKITNIVTKADNQWGTLASKIGFGMPLKIAEENDMFFRGR